jgi:cell wall-associated NlpC family hydrolase
MYIGGGQMIHSPHTGDVVKISAVRGTSYGRIP